MPKEELTKITNELGYFRDLRPDSFPRFTRNQQELLRLIDLYYISQYRDGDTDVLGQKKTFYNIGSLPVDVAAKELDIDTKHIKVFPEDWYSSDGCILFRMELEQWMKLGYFGRQLNYYSHLLSKYGHLVLKKVGNEVHIVPIQNIIFRPDAKSLNDTPLVEIHYYNSEEDFKAEAEVRSWDNADIALADYAKDGKAAKFIVYEAWFPPDMVKGENYMLVSQYGNVLAKERRDKNIYKAIPFEELPGRLLGRGQVEKLFEEQIYLNRIANYKAEGLHWSSKNIFWTRDPNLNSNLLADIDNGDLLLAAERPEKIDTREQNLQVYSYEEQRYEGNAYRRTFSTNPVTGEASAPNVPFRALFLQSQQTGGFYKRKREELASLIKEVIVDWLIPEFKNQKRKEHKVLIQSLMTDQENAEKIIDALVNVKFAERMKKGGVQNIRQQEVLKALIREQIMKDELIIPDSYYDKLKYNIKIDITGEGIDIATRAKAYELAATIAGQNPAAFDNPITARIFKKWFELIGVPAVDIPTTRRELDEIITSQRAQAGGSLPAPDRTPTTMPMAEAMTV